MSNPSQLKYFSEIVGESRGSGESYNIIKCTFGMVIVRGSIYIHSSIFMEFSKLANDVSDLTEEAITDIIDVLRLWSTQANRE